MISKNIAKGARVHHWDMGIGTFQNYDSDGNAIVSFDGELLLFPIPRRELTEIEDEVK